MIPVVSRAEMRAFEAAAIEAARVPSLLLMENAGRAVADAVVARRASSGAGAHPGPVVVVCGAGNNGGDGLVAARHLLTRGQPVEAHLLAPPESLRGDARVNHDALAGLGARIVVATADLGALGEALARAPVVVDAIFGTGLDRPVAGLHAACIESLRAREGRVVAVDVPSGMDADTGETLGVAVRASVTVTFGFRKLGLVTPRGAELAGEVRVADIGVPPRLGDALACSARLLEPRDVARLLVPRATGAYKGTAGHALVLAGSPGKAGAALLASGAALRAGAGLVTLATWPESLAAVEGRIPEIMTVRLDRADVRASVDAALAGKRVVVVGPGFGTDPDAKTAVEHALATFGGPVVVDADALALFAGRPEALAASRAPLVLTPHPGELGRLLSRSAAEVESDRFGSLRAAVSRTRCVVVLKGAHTLIGGPGEIPVVNASGNAAMGTAGAGDVLSGILAAMLAGQRPFEAAWVSVHLHGMAGDLWRDEHGDRGLYAHELGDRIPAAIRALTSAHGHCLA